MIKQNSSLIVSNQTKQKMATLLIMTTTIKHHLSHLRCVDLFNRFLCTIGLYSKADLCAVISRFYVVVIHFNITSQHVITMWQPVIDVQTPILTEDDVADIVDGYPVDVCFNNNVLHSVLVGDRYETHVRPLKY